MAAEESNPNVEEDNDGGEDLPVSVNILLAEDNVVNQEVATRMLMKFGCNIKVAQNGREAVEMAEKFPYDLIFMDCQMPEMDGYMATREIRQRAGDISRIPIIALTASAMQEDIERCLESGMNDVISKPVKMKELKKIIKKWHSMAIGEGTKTDEVFLTKEDENIDILRQAQDDNHSVMVSLSNHDRQLGGFSGEPKNPEELSILIDREGALNRMGGDEELYMDLIKLFIDNAPEQITQLKEAIEAMDMDLAKRSAHSLKGASANVGFVTVQQAALQAEALSVNKEWEKLKDSFEYIKIEFEKVRSLLPLSKSEAG